MSWFADQILSESICDECKRARQASDAMDQADIQPPINQHKSESEVNIPPPQKPVKTNSSFKSGCLITIAVVIGIFFLAHECDNETASVTTGPPTAAVEPNVTITSIPNALTVPTSTLPEITSSLEASRNLIVSNELMSRQYEWTYEGSKWDWELNVPQSLYDYYKALPRSPTKNYSIYVTHPLEDKFINNLATNLIEGAQKKGYNDFQTVSYAASFVQSLPYTSDLATTGYDEYARYPVETLVDNGGDCEDTAILTASLIRAMNYGVVLLVFPKTSQSPGHCAIGVKCSDKTPGTSWNYNGAKYYYLETTGDRWEIGDVPDEYQNASARIYPMVPIPILTHTWSYSGTTRLLELKVIVDNLGSAQAQGVYIDVGFDAGNNQWWNSKHSPVSDIDVGGSTTYTMSLYPPVNKYTRLLIQVMYNGYVVEESYSSWFQT